MPIRLPDGSAFALLGIIADADFSGLLMRHDTLKALGFRPGQWLEVESARQDTQIVRVMDCADCQGYTTLQPSFVYMDADSAHCLGGELGEIVRVKPSLFTFSIP